MIELIGTSHDFVAPSAIAVIRIREPWVVFASRLTSD